MLVLALEYGRIHSGGGIVLLWVASPCAVAQIGIVHRGGAYGTFCRNTGESSATYVG